ncbi:MAG: hypothetical protein ACFFCP_01460 [Promethearchaeota archaeon]
MSKKKTKNDDDPELGLRETMRKKLRTSSAQAGKRTVSVMTRLSPEMVEILDNLAALGIFKSRADAVAAIVEKTLLAQIDSFNQLKKHVEKLDEIQEEAMDIAVKALDGER